MRNITVIIPAYKVKSHIINVINEIPSFVKHILVIDDGCLEKSGRFVELNCKDSRIEVIYHEKNRGVGAATKSGYARGMQLNADILVKIDGDGQMNPSEIEQLINPIQLGVAEYAKGNRFVSLSYLRDMPKIRMFGNIILSFISKASSGYWSIRDPNNGFTAIHVDALRKLDLNVVDNRYFFESDMLFNLYLVNTIVKDVPMKARYENEKSNLSVFKSSFEFSYKHFRNFHKRLYVKYIIQDFNLTSFQLIFGMVFLGLGSIIGLFHWVHGMIASQETNAGTVGLVAILMILGINSIYLFLDSDVKLEPKNISYSP